MTVSVKFQYGDWLRVPTKKRQEVSTPPKEHAHFHEDGSSSTTRSDFSDLGGGIAFKGSFLRGDHVTNAMINKLFDTISVECGLEDSIANALFSNMHVSGDGSSIGMSTMPDQVIDVVPLQVFPGTTHNSHVYATVEPKVVAVEVSTTDSAAAVDYVGVINVVVAGAGVRVLPKF
ncbi:hypothetical protein V6N13_047091 [Hibiscus sabdariffa]|uniref:Uncharacterized protein n=2 Tax=Hibiscus sabdariffa TaxID=183260 RepID=A0ABR2CAG0_9ROSI